MTTSDARRLAYHRFRKHHDQCPKARLQQFCQVCWDLARDASAESWRRSVAREQVAR